MKVVLSWRVFFSFRFVRLLYPMLTHFRADVEHLELGQGLPEACAVLLLCLPAGPANSGHLKPEGIRYCLSVLRHEIIHRLVQDTAHRPQKVTG